MRPDIPRAILLTTSSQSAIWWERFGLTRPWWIISTQGSSCGTRHLAKPYVMWRRRNQAVTGLESITMAGLLHFLWLLLSHCCLHSAQVLLILSQIRNLQASQKTCYSYTAQLATWIFLIFLFLFLASSMSFATMEGRGCVLPIVIQLLASGKILQATYWYLTNPAGSPWSTPRYTDVLDLGMQGGLGLDFCNNLLPWREDDWHAVSPVCTWPLPGKHWQKA